MIKKRFISSNDQTLRTKVEEIFLIKGEVQEIYFGSKNEFAALVKLGVITETLEPVGKKIPIVRPVLSVLDRPDVAPVVSDEFLVVDAEEDLEGLVDDLPKNDFKETPLDTTDSVQAIDPGMFFNN